MMHTTPHPRWRLETVSAVDDAHHAHIQTDHNEVLQRRHAARQDEVTKGLKFWVNLTRPHPRWRLETVSAVDDAHHAHIQTDHDEVLQRRHAARQDEVTKGLKFW